MSISRPARSALLAATLVLTLGGGAIAQSPSPATSAAPPAASPAASPAPSPVPVALEGTEWILQKLVITGADLADVPTGFMASLLLQDGTATGSGGCNAFSGTYTLDGSSLTFGAMASTMMSCPDPQGSTEQPYLAAFANVASYQIEGSGLTMLDANSKPVLVYVAAPPATVNGVWLVTDINNGKRGTEPVISGSLLTAVFMPDGTVQGSTGCNRFSGSYTVDGDSITMGTLTATTAACTADDLTSQSQQYLADLAASTRWTLTEPTLELKNTDKVGATQVLFTRASKTDYIGRWDVTGFNNGTAVATPTGDAPLTVVFLADGMVGGSGGCNTYTGPYTVSGSSIAIGPLATTRAACPSADATTQETQFLTALQAATAWAMDGTGVTLTDSSGATQVTLAPNRGK